MREYYAQDIDYWGRSINSLEACGNSIDGFHERCQSQYQVLRNAYKRVEVILEYVDHEAVSTFFNGPPLLSLEKHVPQIVVLEPEGMQVIDETLCLEPESPVDIEAFTEQVKGLKKRYTHLVGSQTTLELQHHHVWNAWRVALVRLATLGITGFDTPGSAAALDDAIVTISTIQRYFNVYRGMVKNRERLETLDALMAGSLRYLESNNNFETFDRLEFIKSYINPLFFELKLAQQEIGIAFPEETNDDLPALNLNAGNIFSKSLLKQQYFTGIDDNDITPAQIELGRTLFFDPVLSSNMQRSCASCHSPDKAFTDGRTKSLALDKQGSILRNAPTLVNCLYAESYFYDVREDHLERQIKHVVLDSHEFNTDFLEIVDRLGQSDEYRNMFEEAFPGSPYQLSKWSVSHALAVYVASLSSFDSPVDRFVRGESDHISESVYRGFNLFMGKAACGSCHFAPAFNGTVPPYYQHTETEVLGVPGTPDTANVAMDPDLGRAGGGRVEYQSQIYAHSFKTPTVRNIALTAPYMHNGVYPTLEQVIDFYDRGGGIGLGMDVPYQTLPPTPLELDSTEIADLVAFMEALTDTTGMTQRPERLPTFPGRPAWDSRLVGGEY